MKQAIKFLESKLDMVLDRACEWLEERDRRQYEYLLLKKEMARNKPQNKRRPMKSIKNGRKHRDRIAKNHEVLKKVAALEK
jgi:hypothetical protein